MIFHERELFKKTGKIKTGHSPFKKEEIKSGKNTYIVQPAIV